MLTIAKSKLDFEFKHWDKLLFEEHTDYDLAGCIDAVALKSLDGKIHNFYRQGDTENPQDFSYTAYYKLFKSLVDYFEVQTTRIRIHRQLPGKKTPLHTDDNNKGIKEASEYNLRLLTALTESDKFLYQFEYQGKLEQINLKAGESVIFDPDTVSHGMINNSKNKIRYSLIQVFKAYPVTNWLTDFINKEQIIKL